MTERRGEWMQLEMPCKQYLMIYKLRFVDIRQKPCRELKRQKRVVLGTVDLIQMVANELEKRLNPAFPR